MNGESVRVYSRAKDGLSRPIMANGKPCKNFLVNEFASHDNADPVFISPMLLTILQDVRDKFGPVNIAGHSGYRTPLQNKKVGGSTYSYHLYGRAADFHVSGVKHQDVYAYLDKKYPNSFGIGLYSWGIHVDDRGTKSRWNG